MSETSEHPEALISKDPKFTPKLNEALAKAQGEFIQPEKNKSVEVKKEGRTLYTTKYADLKNVIESFRQQLSKNGLSFTQKTILGSKGWILLLTLRHSSGEYDETGMPINLEGPPQQVGSQLTYLKRYQAAAYFGIAADDDDDANGATGNQAEFNDKPNRSTQKPAATTARPPATKPAAAKPAAKEVHPEDTPQQFPPDETEKAPPKEPEFDPKDPGEHIVLFGTTTTGKKIKQLNESTLKEMLIWVDGQLKIVPPPNNMSILFDFKQKARAFLLSVGVSLSPNGPA